MAEAERSIDPDLHTVEDAVETLRGARTSSGV
jgi:hypothetical protein